MLNGQIGIMLENELNNVFKPTKRDTFHVWFDFKRKNY